MLYSVWRVIVALVLLLSIAPAAVAQPALPDDVVNEGVGITDEVPRPSPLKRKDLPPLTVAGLLTFTSEGAWDNPCYLVPSRPPSACEVKIPGGVSFELFDWEPDVDVSAVVERADGTRAERQLQLGGQFRSATWDWPALPGDALGTYRVTASSQHHRVATTLRVLAADATPRSLVYPSRAAAGSEFTLALAGFEPHASVPLTLHRALECTAPSPHGTYRFATQLAPAQTNAAGQAIVHLPTAVDDPACWYAVETEPVSARLFFSEFEVTGTPPGDSVGTWAAVIDEATRVTAAIAGVERAPIENLRRVAAEPLRSRWLFEYAVFRGTGRYVEAVQTGPTVVHSVRDLSVEDAEQLPPTDGFDVPFYVVEVIASEQWAFSVFARDGTLLDMADSRERARYVLRLIPSDPGGELGMHWLIAEEQRLGPE
jgi:hypothetical protein